jgi:hypothetical protein
MQGRRIRVRRHVPQANPFAKVHRKAKPEKQADLISPVALGHAIDAEELHVGRDVCAESKICSGRRQVRRECHPGGQIGGSVHAIPAASGGFPVQRHELIAHADGEKPERRVEGIVEDHHHRQMVARRHIVVCQQERRRVRQQVGAEDLAGNHV